MKQPMTRQDFEQIASEVFRIPKLVTADDFELVIQSGAGVQNKFRNGKPTEEACSRECWISLRVEKRRQLGRATISEYSSDRLQWLVDQAFRAADVSVADPCFRFPLWKTLSLTGDEPEAFPTEVSSVATEALPEGIRLEEKHRSGSLSTGIWRKSEKQQLFFSRNSSDHSFFVGNVRRCDEVPFWLSDQTSLSARGDGAEETLKDVLDRLLSRSIAFQNATPFVGQAPSFIVLGPAVGALMLREMSPFFLAPDFSELESRIPQVVASEKIKIVDDATLPGRAESYPFDLEGVAGQRTVVMENGQTKQLLSDYYSAARQNKLSTGNLRRVWNSPLPSIRPSNLFIEANQTQPLGKLLQLVSSGLYLEGIDSMDVEGDSRLIRASGWTVQEGKLQKPTFGIPLRVQLTDFLKNAVALANDLRFFGSCGAPSIFFENLPLSN